MLKVGQSLPESFASKLGDASISGKNLVVFFYPGDFTNVCTKEACEFRDYSTEFTKRNAVLVGVSPDDASSHERFAAQYKLDYKLLSDSDGTMAGDFGLKRLIPLLPPRRATFVIDSQRTVRAVIHKELDYKGHVNEALQALDNLQ